MGLEEMVVVLNDGEVVYSSIAIIAQAEGLIEQIQA